MSSLSVSSSAKFALAQKHEDSGATVSNLDAKTGVSTCKSSSPQTPLRLWGPVVSVAAVVLLVGGIAVLHKPKVLALSGGEPRRQTLPAPAHKDIEAKISPPLLPLSKPLLKPLLQPVSQPLSQPVSARLPASDQISPLPAFDGGRASEAASTYRLSSKDLKECLAIAAGGEKKDSSLLAERLGRRLVNVTPSSNIVQKCLIILAVAPAVAMLSKVVVFIEAGHDCCLWAYKNLTGVATFNHYSGHNHGCGEIAAVKHVDCLGRNGDKYYFDINDTSVVVVENSDKIRVMVGYAFDVMKNFTHEQLVPMVLNQFSGEEMANVAREQTKQNQVAEHKAQSLFSHYASSPQLKVMLAWAAMAVILVGILMSVMIYKPKKKQVVMADAETPLQKKQSETDAENSPQETKQVTSI
eukprot:GHVT01102461.1.p1 GENE.GHVT01102461.1~~GHVT01102461.1.p1  ORF type:complete len:411 (-),score=58.62 GHVT01102461.1:360-1592(-)